METLQPFLYPVLAGLFGVFAHILKRAQVNGEGLEALTGYLRGHLISILLTFIGFAVQIGIAYQLEALNLYSAFLAGYLANSIFAKAEKTGGMKLPKFGG